MSGIIIAAPTSGSGKTTITLGILRAMNLRSHAVRSAKSGPDYIDPRFHAIASGQPCVNLDAWAMTPDRICALAAGETPLLIEGAMGLFDGAPPDGKGATADLARILNIPVVLVIDAARQAQSVVPLFNGFANHQNGVNIDGVILNNVGSPRHETILRKALDNADITVFGAVHRDATINMPSRHLGLVQADEHRDIEAFLNNAAKIMMQSIDLKELFKVARPLHRDSEQSKSIQPPAQSIAIASDQAFAFTYPHLLDAWRDAGATLSFFSPLNNEAPKTADLVYLPGGYPELHAGKIASNQIFMNGLSSAARVYGECGGYMVMGKGLVDADGVRHEMAGLLNLETSFQHRKLTLGYRDLQSSTKPFNGRLKAHEFHYATTLRADGEPLFNAWDAEGTALAPMGLQNEKHLGSFAHIIDHI